MNQLTIEGLRALHESTSLACPTPGCEVFPFGTQAELDDHIARGDHVFLTGSRRFQTQSNGFGGTTTVRADADQPRPQFRRGTTDPMTKAQSDFIRKLLEEKAGHPEAEAVRADLNRWREAGGVNKVGASDAINRLKAIPRPQAPSQPEPQARGFRARPNQYDGECDNCGRRVAAGEGLLTGKGDDGKWVITHAEGECQPSDFPFPLGRYALAEDGVVKFYVANEDGLFVQASDDLFPIRSADHRTQIIEAIAADPKAAAILYGREIGVCGRCGRTLTDESSREAGIGPVCAKKAWS